MRYADITATERKAKFIQALIGKAQGLTKSELEKIANHRWQLGYKYKDGLAEDFDLVENMMAIIVHQDARSFSKAATLDNVGVTHSWAGKNTSDQFGNWIIGDGAFGTHVDLSHSQNGSMGTPETEDTSPDFDVNSTQVIALKTVNHDSLSDQNATYHSEEWELHIFLGKGRPPVDPELEKIMSGFNL